MFRITPILSRHEALQSICRCFGLSDSIGRKLLNYMYPIAFWQFLSVSEYEMIGRELSHPSDKKIIKILGENSES